jgi:hypothetical protein
MKWLYQHPEKLSQFQRTQGAQGETAAMRFARESDLHVRRGELSTWALDTLGRMDADGRAAFERQHAARLADEREALRLLAEQPGVHPVLAEAATAEVTAQRAAWVDDRAAALEREWWTARRAEWRAAAEGEAAARFDVQPEPARAKRRSA